MNTIDFQTDSGVALLTIDVKDRSMNVLTPEFISDFQEAITRVVGDDAIKGAVITSGKSSFLAGADLTELVAAFEQNLELCEKITLEVFQKRSRWEKFVENSIRVLSPIL